MIEDLVKSKWVGVETEVETEAAIEVDHGRDVTKVAESPKDLEDQDLGQDRDPERDHQNDTGMSWHQVADEKPKCEIETLTIFFSAGIIKAVDITLDVIEDVLAQIPTIPPVQIQIAKLPTKSELFP